MKLGSTDINKAYLGSTEINKIYLGSTTIFSQSAGSGYDRVPIDTYFSSAITQNDATLTDCWDGVSTQLLKNAIGTPDHTSTQADNDLIIGVSSSVEASDPAFVGTVGDPAAYFLSNGSGSGVLTNTNNSSIWRNLQRVNSGGVASWSLICTFYSDQSDFTGVEFFNSVRFFPGIRLYGQSLGRLRLIQAGNTSSVPHWLAGEDSLDPISGSGNYIVGISYDASANTLRAWINERADRLSAKTANFNASTSVSEYNFYHGRDYIGAATNPTGFRYYGTSILAEALTDATWGNVVDYYNTLHGRVYC